MVFPIERKITPDDYIELLNSSGLGERGRAGGSAATASMPGHGNRLDGCRDGDRLLGAARCFTDFAYVTYCSDLSVRAECQRRGIGRGLLRTVLRAAPCRLVLLAASKAVDYYPRIGFTQHPSAWTILPGDLR